ncbi:hypothetical protein N0V90_005439 [Kalmusia sp. IMI 367209]|nr:hypothetical protein N0V90_005439 [Kalmusia sp. IMI 367209]
MHLVPRQTSTEPYEVPPSQQFDGNDGSWSTFKISIGTPAQEFRVLASTRSGQTFTVVPGGCQSDIDPPDCANLRGAQVFNSAQSPGFLANESDTWSMIGQYDIDLEDGLNYTSRGLFGYDKVALGPVGDSGELSLDKQVVGGVADMAYYLGHIPLGVTESKFSSQSASNEPLIYQLRNTSNIPSISFSYTAGAKYRLKSVVGQLILGGYDPTRFRPNANDFSFSFSTDPSRLLTVGVDSIIATDTLKGTQSLSSSAHFSLIDSTVPHLWLPRDICDAFEEAFGLTYDSQTDLYLINSTMRDQLQARNPSITIKLIDSLEGAATNFSNIVLPYSAFDLQASYPYYENATRYFPIRRAANDSQYTLGRTMLQEAYLIVDYERANFTLAQAAFTDPLPSANILTIYPPGFSSATSNSRLSTAAKAGIAIACIAFAILTAFVYLFYRRRRRRSAHKNPSELGGRPISEAASSAVAPTAPRKLSGPQELSGTPRAELAGPVYEKPCVSVNIIPQELETPVSTMRPRFEEVTVDEYVSYRSREGVGVDGSTGISGVESQVSDDGRQSVVSPLSGRFHERDT